MTNQKKPIDTTPVIQQMRENQQVNKKLALTFDELSQAVKRIKGTNKENSNYNNYIHYNTNK